MKFRLKQGTQKKLTEQLYLMLFFGVVIWLLMAWFFYKNDNPQMIIIYLIGSAVIVPYLYSKRLKPYLRNLATNIDNAYFEFDGNNFVFNHFENLRKFKSETIEFSTADIANLKKAFRKDDSVNKITLTLKNKTKIVVEDFENMTELVDLILNQLESDSKQAQDPKL